MVAPTMKMLLVKTKRREQAPALRYEIDFSAKVAEARASAFLLLDGRSCRLYIQQNLSRQLFDGGEFFLGTDKIHKFDPDVFAVEVAAKIQNMCLGTKRCAVYGRTDADVGYCRV